MSVAAPATISNIQMRVYTDAKNYMTRQTVEYDRKNANGTRERVERVWMEGGGGPNPYNNLASSSFLITPTVEELSFDAPYGLKAYIAAAEKAGTKPLAYMFNTGPAAPSCTGKLIKATPILPPPEEQIKTLTAETKKLSQSVTALTDSNKALTTANQALAKTNQEQAKELAEIKKSLADLTALLKGLGL